MPYHIGRNMEQKRMSKGDQDPGKQLRDLIRGLLDYLNRIRIVQLSILGENYWNVTMMYPESKQLDVV